MTGIWRLTEVDASLARRARVRTYIRSATLIAGRWRRPPSGVQSSPQCEDSMRGAKRTSFHKDRQRQTWVFWRPGAACALRLRETNRADSNERRSTEAKKRISAVRPWATLVLCTAQQTDGPGHTVTETCGLWMVQISDRGPRKPLQTTRPPIQTKMIYTLRSFVCTVRAARNNFSYAP